MTSSGSKNEMLVMVLTDLAAICDKVAEHPAVPEELRTTAREFVLEFNSLVADRGDGTAAEHFEGDELLVKMARFLPRVLEVSGTGYDLLQDA